MIDVVVLSDCLANHARTHLDSLARLEGMIDRARKFPPSLPLPHAAAWEQGLQKIEEDLLLFQTEDDVADAAGALS
jgi:hypothetical protein